MNKINIEVMVPALGKKYEFIVAATMKVDTAVELITKVVADNENLKDLDSKEKTFYLMNTQCLLKGSTLELAGVWDGSRLIMV